MNKNKISKPFINAKEGEEDDEDPDITMDLQGTLNCCKIIFNNIFKPQNFMIAVLLIVMTALAFEFSNLENRIQEMQ